VLLFGAAALPAAGPEKLAPVDEAGYQQLVASNKGKVVLVNFWATWCAPCRQEMPALVKLDGELRQKGFKLVTISADEAEEEPQARKFLQQQNAPSPAFIKKAKSDEKFINAIDVKWSGALPASFLYDKTGKKVRSFIGEVSVKELEAAVRKLL
jgi:thiol-disulfide isomerase/thioredoxin